MSKVNNKITRTRSMTSFGVFTVNFEHISHLFLVFLLLTLNNVGWVDILFIVLKNAILKF